MRKKVALIVNPASGTVSKHRIIPDVLRCLSRYGYDVELQATNGPGHATAIAVEIAENGSFDGVLVAGGDGTVNEAARGLIGTTTPLGIIPCGSGNGLARHLGIPVDVARSLRVICENHVIAADYGTANGEPFFCTFGVGFDAAVSERFARQKRRGLMMYLKSVIDEYVSFSPERYVIEVNGQTISDRAFLVVVCNASQYGNNAFIAPDASVTDGELDITVVHTGNIFQNAVLGVDFLTGYLGKNALIDTFRTSNLRITRTSHGAAHIDGDPALMSSEISIECHPGKLKLFSPTRQTSFRPIITPVSLFFRDMALAAAHLLPFHKR